MHARRQRAYLVHLYTASGMALVALSAHLLLQGRFEASLAAMLLAMAVDSTDGMLARRVNIKTVLPEYDGRRMDDVIDYVSYVFLPVLFMLQANMLMQPVVLWATVPLVASVFGFGRVDAKLDEEGFFLGFPSYWNVVVFYCYMFSLPAWTNTVIVGVLAALVFVPVRYLYISRLISRRRLNFGLALIWAGLLGTALWVSKELRPWLLTLSLFFPTYYTVSSLLLDRRARERARLQPSSPAS